MQRCDLLKSCRKFRKNKYLCYCSIGTHQRYYYYPSALMTDALRNQSEMRSSKHNLKDNHVRFINRNTQRICLLTLVGGDILGEKFICILQRVFRNTEQSPCPTDPEHEGGSSH